MLNKSNIQPRIGFQMVCLLGGCYAAVGLMVYGAVELVRHIF